MVLFEGLLKDTCAWFGKFIDFSPYDYQKGAFRYALKFSKYDNLHKKERKERDLKNSEAFHTRKSSKGEGKDKLSNSARDFLTEKLVDGLKGILREYYIPGNPQKKVNEWTKSTLNSDH